MQAARVDREVFHRQNGNSVLLLEILCDWRLGSYLCRYFGMDMAELDIDQSGCDSDEQRNDAVWGLT